ncbi:Non-specific serine/threonine protein kinase [Purpureocillium takamizusanense]|uniref:Non-specific serine/threonine protein kinase n=1 Tax=Purpureocillium takamizusanense TaxID=2060973 RepID=A0A9Q8VHA9_9HYPO|nr:Non-specific serine/threonine protein kinase [Purpureocillium takamizusanense]UNI24602.1 Non-specific serine/threonine protein kinase [Purpureocillium takamizusanense]
MSNEVQPGGVLSPSEDDPRPTDDAGSRSKTETRSPRAVKYIKGTVLGRGGYGTVYKVRRVSDGMIFAGKASKSLRGLEHEANALRSLNHENILRLVELYRDPENPSAAILITEWCPYGTLQERIDQATPNMDKSEIKQVMIQISDALTYLHDEKRLYHRDVKPRNILIRGLHPFSVILADCGDVRRLESKGSLRGTPQYYSPEILQYKRHYGSGDDVWALGVTLAGMLRQCPQFRLSDKIVTNNNDDAAEELRKWPHRLQNHVQQLLALNPRHWLVRTMAEMLAWEVDERISAAACAEAFRVLNEESMGEPGKPWDFGIASPEGFKPISFW